jgi:hypothetical protein
MKILVATHDGNGIIKEENFSIQTFDTVEELEDVLIAEEDLAFWINIEEFPTKILLEMCGIKGISIF